MKAEIHVDAGVCGFKTDILADSGDNQHVTFRVSTDCDKIGALGDAIEQAGEFDAFNEINPAAESVLLKHVRAHLKGCCAGCGVPVGLFKGMQVAAGIALPKDVLIAIAKKE